MAVMHSVYRETGEVSIDPAVCKQCGKCAMICPAEVLAMDEGHVRKDSDSPLGCIACGHCMMVCAEGAVRVTGRGVCPEDIIPLPDREGIAGADELEALMKSRRSVRKFSDRQVETALLDRIVEMASMGPMGIPPWDVGCVKVCGREEVKRIAAEVIKGYVGFLKIFKPWLLKIMRPFIGKAKYDMFAHFLLGLAEMYVRGHREGRDTLFYEAPAVLIFYQSSYADDADAVIACTYAMLAAESMGLGSTIIGGATPIIQRNKPLCRQLGIPEGNKPTIALVLGYPAAKFEYAIRRRFSSLDPHDR